MERIGIEKCSCGHESCINYWLTNVGCFVQGSGFTKGEAQAIADLLNISSQPTNKDVEAPQGEGWRGILRDAADQLRARSAELQDDGHLSTARDMYETALELEGLLALPADQGKDASHGR